MEDKGEQLRKEAKKRGYTHDNFRCIINRELKGLEDINEWHYEELSDTLYTMPVSEGGNAVYRNGTWAALKETLQEKEQRLLKELEEVKALIEEENKPKVGDWCKFWDGDKSRFIVGKLEYVYEAGVYPYHVHGIPFRNCMKITDSTLLESLSTHFL